MKKLQTINCDNKMKKLYLLRHAQSGSKQALDDHSRTINAQGKQECKAMNAYIIQNNIKPEIILCSDAVRTQETGQAVFQGNNDIKITANKKLYQATPGEILKEIAKIDDSVGSVMIIAHNPGIGQLAKLLAGSGDMEIIKRIGTEYPTCGLTELSFNVERWKKIDPGSGVLERFF